MSDISETLRKTTEQMAATCSVPMELWCEHSAAAIRAADEIGRIAKASTDIGILISLIDDLQEATGETLDSEDMAIVSQIKGSWCHPAAITTNLTSPPALSE